MEMRRIEVEDIPSLSDDELDAFVTWADFNREHAYEGIFYEPDYDGYRITSCTEGGVEDKCFICTAEGEQVRRRREHERTLPGNSVLSAPGIFMGQRPVREMEMGWET